MASYFDKIRSDYENAEITTLILHERSTKKFRNLLTIIELVPPEQEPSSLIGDVSTFYARRENIDDEYTLFLARTIIASVDDAVKQFQNPSAGIHVKYGGKLDALVVPFEGTVLEKEPSSEQPLLIGGKEEHTIGKLLPQRKTSFRVWAAIDRRKKWLDTLNSKQVAKVFQKAGALTREFLGFDISRMAEHAGNIYLCCCNPYLRSYGQSLIDHNRELLIHFNERVGKTIIGSKLVLEDLRAGNLSFSIEHKITSIRERILLPHFPDQLQTKLYDDRGYIIEKNQSGWINFSFQMQTQTAQVNLTIKEGNKKRKLVIHKYASERPVQIGEYDHSLINYLKSYQKKRQLDQLEENKEFIFFPGSDEDCQKAQEVVGELLNRASKKCMLLDPYFGAPDLFYAYVIRNTSIPIQILSSAAFLKGKATTPGGRKIANVTRLKQAFIKYKKIFPHQSIECRVLLGGKSPLHDRYIITDDTIYLLGSSFNEFGTRATTLIKVPAAQKMIDQAEAWWKDNSKTLSLDDYVKRLKTGK